jgi:hypothetical protein
VRHATPRGAAAHSSLLHVGLFGTAYSYESTQLDEDVVVNVNLVWGIKVMATMMHGL